ncbi:glycosyltransferase family 4 protein [Bradyrhizobium sp. GCM10023182]|uniref:Glycosyltransferase family 4 protein n=1 Tax=Bradyrhizobium zhengyangense TaxID=2911009 RepID=A0ABS9M1Q2_9BRAD|nr:glycosyltransferase family 4 protein [Bradyrhizobium zhengyangense]MCG2673207.1 glycosyltransferase family 4 protein [Bradyrhizobium zhengyangense]
MRINFILPTPSMAGGIRVVAIYADELARRGHEVCLISPPPRQPVFVEKFKSWVKGAGWRRAQVQLQSHLDGLELNHRVLETWRPIVDQDVPDGDVVIATWWETAEWVSRLGAKKGAKVYFIQHHEVFPYLLPRSRDTYRLPLHKIVVAKWLKDIMINEYGDRNVDIVPNSVDHSQFFAPVRRKQRIPTAGFLYATTPFKGADLSIAALQIVAKRIASLRCISFGSEPISRSLPLPNGTEYVLNPAQDQIRNLYAECDVWVTASRTEGFNLPAMEAMACRTPVVSTRTGWPAESIKSGWNGALVEIEDLAGLADGVESVLSSAEEHWQRLSLNAHSTVASSSWKRSTDLFEQALERICRRASRNEKGDQGDLEEESHEERTA